MKNTRCFKTIYLYTSTIKSSLDFNALKLNKEISEV